MLDVAVQGVKGEPVTFSPGGFRRITCEPCLRRCKRSCARVARERETLYSGILHGSGASVPETGNE